MTGVWWRKYVSLISSQCCSWIYCWMMKSRMKLMKDTCSNSPHLINLKWSTILKSSKIIKKKTLFFFQNSIKIRISRPHLALEYNLTIKLMFSAKSNSFPCHVWTSAFNNFHTAANSKKLRLFIDLSCPRTTCRNFYTNRL